MPTASCQLPTRLYAAAIAACLAAVLAAAAPAGAQVADPCDTDFNLKCPDLVMQPPYDIRVDTKTRPGRVLLRAANSIDNVGLGPAELRGFRDGRYTMYARQRIHRYEGARRAFRTGARLGFKFIPRQGRYWKFRDAARFELWRLDPDTGARLELVEASPKLYYCYRDLRRVRRLSDGRPYDRSPRRERFAACSQAGGLARVTLGTSVGWADIYPWHYPQNWIDVTGRRGCFAYVHIADPRDHFRELDETNNASSVTIRLPWRGASATGCTPTPQDPESDEAGRGSRELQDAGGY